MNKSIQFYKTVENTTQFIGRNAYTRITSYPSKDDNRATVR